MTNIYLMKSCVVFSIQTQSIYNITNKKENYNKTFIFINETCSTSQSTYLRRIKPLFCLALNTKPLILKGVMHWWI